MPRPGGIPRPRALVGQRHWRLSKQLGRVAAKLRGGRISQFEHVSPDGAARIDSLDPELLLRWKKRIPALTDPPTVPARTLALTAEELVLGAEADGEARMWPTSTLRVHHVVNDRLGGAPFLVTFCLKCFSAVAFDPVVDGRRLTFQLFGMYEGAAVMQDEATGTVWAHLTGEAMLGPMAGQALEVAPIQMTSFERWLELHPESLAPDPAVMVPPVVKRPGEAALDREFQATISGWDKRLPARTYVLGVSAGEATRAYPLDVARPGPRVLLDDLGGVPIILLGDDGTFPKAYDRRVDGHAVSASLQDDRVVDETGTVWGSDGVATGGPLAGARLTYLPTHLVEWFAWSAYHPETEVAQAPS